MNHYGLWIQAPWVSKFDGEFSCLLKRAKKNNAAIVPLVPSAKAIVGFHQWGFWPLCYTAEELST